MGKLLAIGLFALAACGPHAGFNEDGGGVGGPADAAQSGKPDAPIYSTIDASYPVDAGNVFDIDATDYGDASSLCGSDWMCTNPIGNGCTGDPNKDETACNGLDDDCDGVVDDGCPCTPGAVQSCFAGPPAKRNVGACQDGQQVCQGSGEFTHWGPCTGGIVPGAEVCDSLDNDCNGCDDDNPACCNVDLNCPAPGSMPDGQPFTDYVIDGTMFWPGPATSWAWTVEGGPCDKLLKSTSGNTSYTLTGQNTSKLTFHPTLSGDYTITVTIVTKNGTVSCTFIVHISGPGLRFELCWDQTGPAGADLDLHVHKDGTTSPWFTTTKSNTKINPEDCYYYNCTAQSFYCPLPPAFCPSDKVDWGPAYPDSAIAECIGTPDGASWQSYGGCHNPRLDIDNIATAGVPENINVDVPLDGSTYRAMVHYYGGSVTTHPLVNVYCGGTLKASYGAAPDLVSGFTAGGDFGAGTMWRVVDVTTAVSGGVTTDCTTTQLHPPGTTTGYWVTNNDRSY